MHDYGDLWRRIGERIDTSDPDGCWIWTGATLPTGYGRFTFGPESISVHRAVYECLVGPIPDGLEIDHLCRVRRCCNPAHLEPVTHAENVRRGQPATGVANYNGAKTHCPNGHPYDASNTYRNSGRRHCRACAAQRRARRNNRAA